jgi:hypothetical protein
MTISEKTIDWKNIERRLKLHGAERFATQEIMPLIEAAPVEALKKDGKRENRLETPLGVAFFGFVTTFVGLMFVLPDNIWSVIFRFLIFFPLFFVWIGAALYLFKDRLIDALTEGQARFVARSKALSTLAEALGLTYVPSPGGAPAALKWIARQGWAPTRLREIADLLDDHGGMDDALAAARASGVMVGNAHVIGGDKSRQTYLDHQARQAQVEDGFQGARGGVPFCAFEWVESVEDAPNVHHLVFVVTAPRRLYGVTQLRSRHITWPAATSNADMKPVGVVAPAFENRFRMRATDQVEARAIFDPVVLERVAEIAHGEKVRAVAFEDRLVIDVEGEDRFAMVDLVTGEWSEETIAQSMRNMAEMLELADAVAHAFKLRAAA